MITSKQIKAIAGPGARSDLVAAIVKGWPNAVAKAKLTTRLRAAHFLAQIMTETGGLRILSESGAYRAPQIMKIFGVGRHSAGITQAEAKRIAALPVAQRGPVLFNRVYGVGNPKKMREFKNTGPNDGWLYRGGGMMQCTGKSNYAVMARKTGLPLVEHPELLHNPDSAFMAAYLEWAQDGRCNSAADRNDVVAVRRIINGGTNGLAECRVFLGKAKTALVNYSVEDAPLTLASDTVSPAVPEIEQGDADPDAVETHEDAPTDVSTDLPIDAPAPEPEEPTGDPAPQSDWTDILSVQKRLIELGYHEVGVADGLWGSKTAAGIAAYKNDKKMPGAPVIDAALISALNETQACRLIPLDRANVTAKDLAPALPAMRQTLWQQLWAKIIGVGAAAIAGFQWIIDQFHSARDYLYPYTEWFSYVPSWIYWAALILVALFIYKSAQTTQENIIEAKKTNRLN